MNALGALMSLLIDEEFVHSPFTNGTGGTSAGNPSAGGDPNVFSPLQPVTGSDRAGAGVLTVLVISAMIATMLWMATSQNEFGSRRDEKGKTSGNTA